MKVGIAIDAWKLPIFKRHLDRDGYTFEQSPLRPGVLLLTVDTSAIEALEVVVKAANTEARKGKLQ